MKTPHFFGPFNVRFQFQKVYAGRLTVNFLYENGQKPTENIGCKFRIMSRAILKFELTLQRLNVYQAGATLCTHLYCNASCFRVYSLSMQQTAYYLKKLKEDFSRRKRGNGVYSLRAFGRDLGVHPSTLSQVLLGKRPLPLKNAPRVLERLSLNGKERTLFIDSLGKNHIALDGIKIPEQDDRFMLDEAYFQIVAEWEHYAVLTLFDCKDFQPTVDEVSRRLEITKTRAEVVIENLLRYGLLKTSEQGTLQKSHPKIRTTEDVASQALRASHQDALELGKRRLDEVPVDLRDFSSMTVALDPSKLPELKTIIREFRQKVSELLKSGNRTEVYQMAIQLYPLTTINRAQIEPNQKLSRGNKNAK